MEGLNEVLLGETPRIGMWLDTSSMTAEQTVDEIMKSVWDRGDADVS